MTNPASSDSTPRHSAFGHEAWAEFADGDRLCHYCGIACLPEDHPCTSRDGAHYAHFVCWYEGAAFPLARLEASHEQS